MTRYQKLVAATLAMTLALVIVGVVVRATGSGLGCPDWPFCYGQIVPPLDFKAWAEWIHRLIAAVIGVMVVGVAVLAVVDHRDRPSLILGVARRGRARDVPGLAGPGDRAPRQLRASR